MADGQAVGPDGTPLPRSLRALVTGIGTAASLIVVGAAIQAARPPAASLTALLFVGAVLAASSALPLRLRFGSSTVLHMWGEPALILGLALLPVPELLILTWLTGLAAHALSFRSAARAIFNAGTATIATLLAAAVARVIAGGMPAPSQFRGALALVVAAGVFSICCDLLASTAVATAQRLPTWLVLRDGLWISQGLWMSNAAVGVVTAALGEANHAAYALLPLTMVALHFGQAGGLRVAKEREAWQRLDVATRDLNRLQLAEVLEVAVVRGSELFRADAVEITLDSPHGARTVGGTRRGVGAETPQVGAAGGAIVRRALEAGEVCLGELRLCFGSRVRLAESESRALSTFSHALSAALLNASLFEEMRQHAAQKEHEAAHDPLTGLANRTVLAREGETALARAVATNTIVALLLLDLDHFKEVNDTLGHEAGDLLLREAAARIKRCTRATDTVVRLGGDEFAVLLPDLDTPASASRVAFAILGTLAEPVVVEELEIPLEASIGLACAPTDADTVGELLRCADVAMYEAKSSPRSMRRYRRESDSTSRSRLTMLPELRSALDHGDFLLHFQPKVDLATGSIVGVEALVRWAHERRGLMAASDFVPIIEQSSMVHNFALHTLELALGEMARWRWAGPGRGSVAVNLSARNLLDRQLPEDVDAALRRHGIAPGQLVIEITETAMMNELEITDDVLAGLRELGVQLSIDDFGTGYSSLSMLSTLRVDELKIDRSFVSAMIVSRGHAAIVQAVSDLAERLGLRVVAEGVETTEQLDRLVALGCATGQGHLLAHPVAAEEMVHLLDGAVLLPVPLAAAAADPAG